MIILRNDARKAYIKLIFEAKLKEKERNEDVNSYYELHHIFPKSTHPKYVNNLHNLVKLTYREHFIAHKLLSEFIPCYSTKIAFAMMGCVVNDKQKRTLKEITPEEYEEARKSRIDAFKLRDEEEIKRIYDKINETIHNKYTPEEISEFHRKVWKTIKSKGENYMKSIFEKRRKTIENYTEEEWNNYRLIKSKAGKCGNTDSAKLKRRNNNIKKFGGNGGCLNDPIILEKYRETLKNKDEKAIKEWKYKCGLSTKGKHYWTNGIITKRSVECPGEGFIIGRGPHKKTTVNFKNGKNPNSIKIEIIETKELFDCIKDLCIKYNIKISIIRKYAIKENKRYWKINENILNLYKIG